METEQSQLLMPEGELVKLGIELSPLAWAVYEGVIDGEDAFAVQGFQYGYATPALRSLRAINRDSLEYDSKNETVILLNGLSVHMYDVGHPKHDKLVDTLRRNGKWIEGVCRR